MTRSTGRLVTGALIVVFGLLLLLGTTGVFPTATLWDWVPALFVLLGVWALARSGFRNLTGPIMVVAIAGTFLLLNLDVLPAGTLGTYWPLFLVLFGVLIIVGRQRRRVRYGDLADEGDLSAFGVFGGGQTTVTSTAFTGGDVVSIFGGNDVDLRQATIEDAPAVIEVVTLFGGTEIRVPEDWTVTFDALGIFGGTEDKRRAVGTGGEPDLIVTGVVMFGAIELLD
jgi:predicted membrane protein